MRQTNFRYIFIFIVLTFATRCYGQAGTNQAAADSLKPATFCPQQDIFDVLTKEKLQAPEIPSRKVRAIILPLVAYSPGTGVQLGAGSSLSWTLGPDPRTNLSAGSVQVLWTTKKQLISYARTTLFLDANRWMIQTDWRWYLFKLPTYGLGTGPSDNIPEVTEYPDTPGSQVQYGGGKFNMKYNWIKFHNILMMSVANHIYAGIGYHFDHYYDIDDENLNLDSTAKVITPHYAYCIRHGFNTLKYTSSGVSLDFAYDTRDNIINSYRGMFINASYQYNFTFLGSNRSGSKLWIEYRQYIGLSKRVPRHILAMRVFGNFTVSGDMPYLNLMATGYDPNNSSGRGYTEGRWRGEDFAYGEVEYRFPISPCSRIVGGVLFANVSTASNRDMGVPLFGYFKPGCGFGLRIMVGKADRTNLLIDFGLGEVSQGLYLQAQEVF